MKLALFSVISVPLWFKMLRKINHRNTENTEKKFQTFSGNAALAQERLKEMRDEKS